MTSWYTVENSSTTSPQAFVSYARPRVHPVPAQRPRRRLHDRASALPDTPAPPLAGAAPADIPAQAALDPAAPVTFDLFGASTCGLGVPMCELAVWSGAASAQRWARHWACNASASSSRCVLSLSSPGGPCREGVELMSASAGVVHIHLYRTLARLAAQLALALQSFIEKCSTHNPALNVGSWHITPSGGNLAATTGISFDRLVLFALWNVCDDVWMAEVFVDHR
ncbi:hypothetical protein ID866_10836 [Astraeus odoratus]|nr:hypothetical protein ID866_10836 [Astraeus odoratus]